MTENRLLNSVMLLVSICVCVFFTSCTTTPKLTFHEPENWKLKYQLNSNLKKWTINGRMGAHNGTDGGSADLYWLQENKNFDIRVIAPFGQGSFYLKKDNYGILLRSSDGATKTVASEDVLLDAIAGIKLPLSALRSWIRGIPEKNVSVDKMQWDDQGDLYYLQQHGWNIEMSDYKNIEKYRFPHKFYMYSIDNPDLNIRLVVRSWNLRS